MKRKRLLLRGAMLLLTLVLAAGCFWPALTAEASDFSIDDSGFVDPTYDHQTLYIWRRGMPVADRQSDVGYKRDLLICWDGMYYLKSTTGLFDKIRKMYPTQEGSDAHDLNVDHLDWGLHHSFWTGVDWDYASEITWENGYYPYDGTNDWNNGKRYYPNGYPQGWYMYYVDYSGTAGLVSSLPFNYSAMSDSDIACTLQETANLPFGAYVGTVDGEKAYGIGIPYAGGPHIGVGTASYGAWLAAEHKLHTWNNDHWWTADEQYTYIRATLDYWEAGDDDTLFTNNGSRSRAESTWRLVPKEGAKTVSIETIGKGATAKYNDDGFADNQDKDDLYNLYHGTLFGYMALAHEGSVFRTVGNANQWAYNYKYDSGHAGGRHPKLANGRDQFDVFWCEAKIIDYLQTPITVANGQVTNLEGPMCNNSTITVKEGGTLTITNWVANLGTIIVEPGGTLYVQEDACLVRMSLPDQYEDHKGGTIISSGLILVGKNAKLCGGGMEGIHLKDGCHVVNYGLVTSENFIIDNAYTVENRSGGVTFYGSGNGVTGSGMGVWANPVSASGYKERGKYEPTCVTNLAPGSSGYVANAIYND